MTQESHSLLFSEEKEAKRPSAAGQPTGSKKNTSGAAVQETKVFLLLFLQKKKVPFLYLCAQANT
jgi:hypothetical protein